MRIVFWRRGFLENTDADAVSSFYGMNIALKTVMTVKQRTKEIKSVSDTRSRIKTKRIYEKPNTSDGSRLLVDRVWPRGLKKDELALDGWLKDVAPSDRLRNWFGHDPRKWNEFRRRYFTELRGKTEAWTAILEKARQSEITLLYGARDPRRNNAAALRDFLELSMQDQELP
jgi:uncharacterized protein YeaO (DUF488 family)